MAEPTAPPPRSVSLITNVMARGHLAVLGDWIGFLDLPLVELVLALAPDPALEAEVAGFAARRGLGLTITARTTPAELAAAETDHLTAQFRAATGDLAVVVRLDTLPFRSTGNDALHEALARLDAERFFITGSTRPFRADRVVDPGRIALTGRVSNNFLVISPQVWLDSRPRAGAGTGLGRFETEGDLEALCARTGRGGFRLLNRPDWRIFHTQVWDDRLETLRADFRAGRGIAPFLRGHEDDQVFEWERYWGPVPPSALRRWRTTLGALRRAPLRETRRQLRRLSG